MKNIKIDAETCRKIEAAHYEVNAIQDLLTKLSSDNLTNKEIMKYWQDLYVEKYTVYNKEKDNMEKQYIIPVIGDLKVNWNLDFKTCEVSITEC